MQGFSMSTLARIFMPKIIQSDSKKMTELTPDLYKELLRYKTQANHYYRQPIDLSNYRAGLNESEAA